MVEISGVSFLKNMDSSKLLVPRRYFNIPAIILTFQVIIENYSHVLFCVVFIIFIRSVRIEDLNIMNTYIILDEVEDIHIWRRPVDEANHLSYRWPLKIPFSRYFVKRYLR